MNILPTIIQNIFPVLAWLCFTGAAAGTNDTGVAGNRTPGYHDEKINQRQETGETNRKGIYRKTGIHEQVYYPENVLPLSEWSKDISGKKLTCEFESGKDTRAILSWVGQADILINGDTVKPEQVPLTREPFARFVLLRRGKNIIEAFPSQPETFKAFICDAGGIPFGTNPPGIPSITDGKMTFPGGFREPVYHSQATDKTDIRDFHHGTGGGTFPSCGRFGFTDEAGLLDYSQYAFGVIGKQYRMGHPGNIQTAFWRISCRPPHTDCNLYHSALQQIDTGKNAGREVNWISFKTTVQLRSTGEFHDRKKEDLVNFSTTVSLASPGYLIETDDQALVLSELAPAGEFMYLGIPKKEGFTITNTLEGGEVYQMQKDGPFADNWLLLWGGSRTGTLESPLLIVLQHQPEKITFDRVNDRFEISGKRDFGYAILASPLGIEWTTPEQMISPEWIGSITGKCNFWSKALLAYPVDAEEFYRIDEKEEMVHIVQQFRYRYLTDDWNSTPIEVAPLPPPVSLAADRVKEISLNNAVNLHFPTKYGDLYGITGSNRSSYTIPLPSLARRFPLKPSGEKEIARLFSLDFGDYLDYHDGQPAATPNPGAYAALTHFAFPLTVFNFIKNREREELAKRLNHNLPLVTRRENTYIFDNSLGGRSQFDSGNTISGTCQYWYERTEPHTKANYMTTYLHVSGIMRFGELTRENIEKSAFPMIEVDWGNGYSLYTIYLSALLTGNWDPVVQNWPLLKKAFRYFEVMHDWACMSAAYAEDGVTWNDGTNLGAYLGFSQMARLTGDQESYDRSRYAAAKHLILRFAHLLAGSDYYPRYFGGKPWWTHKFFHEDLASGSRRFICCPLMDGQIRREAIYNFSTEGLYPEIIDIYNRYLPDALHKCRDVIYESEPDCLERADPEFLSWNGSNLLGRQEVYSLLLIDIADRKMSEKETAEKISKAHAHERLFHEWITANPKYRRRVPANWSQCSLLSMLKSRNDPAWLENWRGIHIESAEYNSKKKEAVVTISEGSGVLYMGIARQPVSVSLNHRETAFRLTGDNSLSVDIASAGILRIKF